MSLSLVHFVCYVIVDDSDVVHSGKTIWRVQEKRSPRKCNRWLTTGKAASEQQVVLSLQKKATGILLTIHHKCPPLYTARINDCYLINLFITFGYSGYKLVQLNKCRMFLKAITVADITTADGKFVTSNTWAGTQDNQQCHDFLWP
jgi:hypothetical protein